MPEKKSIGIVEYHDDQYILDVIEIVKKNIDTDIEFISLKNHGISRLKKYDVIYDMISPFNKYVCEIMKIYYLNGTYIINNPFIITLYNKILQTAKLAQLGIPMPKTIFAPNIFHESDKNFDEDLVQKPDFDEIIMELGLPILTKPYDGYGNDSIHVINNKKELEDIWNKEKERIHLFQTPIVPDDFYRVFCVNDGNVNFLKREPRFVEAKNWDFEDTSRLTPKIKKQIETQSAIINREFGYDLTSIEWSIDKEGNAYVIDINDAPNIADPIEAKETDLWFPEDFYNWLIKNISEMIIKKAELSLKGSPSEDCINISQIVHK